MIFNLIAPMRSWSWFVTLGSVVLEDLVCVVGVSSWVYSWFRRVVVVGCDCQVLMVASGLC